MELTHRAVMVGIDDGSDVARVRVDGDANAPDGVEVEVSLDDLYYHNQPTRPKVRSFVSCHPVFRAVGGGGGGVPNWVLALCFVALFD